MSGLDKETVFEGVLEVDVAGGCVVELIGVCELHVLGLITCVGCDIVKGDHAPDGGVAQEVIHGVFRHHGRNQEEVEEELEKEVERQEEEDAQTPMRMTMTMDEMERHCEALEPM